MANRQISGLTADTTPARTDVIAKQDAAGSTEAEKSTIAQILGLAVLSDASDVTITSVADDHILVYDSGTSQWVNQAELSVDATGVNNGDVLSRAAGAPAWKADKFGFAFSSAVTAAGTYQLPPWPNKPGVGVDVCAHTWGGTCSIQLTKNGSNISGFTSAVAQTTSVTTTTSTETYAKSDKMALVVAASPAPSSLTGVAVTINARQT